MQIHTISAEQKLVSVASSIGRSPSSWQGWSVLQIEVCDLSPGNSAESCLLWVDSILGSYLKDVEGQAYFCHGRSIHVLCKNVSYKILDQVGQQILILMKEEDGLLAEYKVHNLELDGFSYVSDVFENQSDVRSLSISKYSEAVRLTKIESLEQMVGEKQILNHKDYARVLLVEDDPVTRWIVRNSLKHECQFATAPNAHQAFSKFQAFQPDIVFLDIDLPDKSGRDVLEWIMRNDPGVCVVMFSSNDNLDNISQTLEDGASGFIAKPFLKEDLIGYIRAHAHSVSSCDKQGTI